MQREIMYFIQKSGEAVYRSPWAEIRDVRYRVVCLATFETPLYCDSLTDTAARAVANRLNGFDSTFEELLRDE